MQIVYHGVAVGVVCQQPIRQLGAGKNIVGKDPHQHHPAGQQHGDPAAHRVFGAAAPADPYRGSGCCCRQTCHPQYGGKQHARQQTQRRHRIADAPAQFAPAGKVLLHLMAAGGAPYRFTRQNVVGGDAVQLRQRRKDGDIGKASAALPFADGLVGHAKAVGHLLLGHPRALPQRRQIAAGFHGIHMVTLLSSWCQYAAAGAEMSTPPFRKSVCAA